METQDSTLPWLEGWGPVQTSFPYLLKVRQYEYSCYILKSTNKWSVKAAESLCSKIINIASSWVSCDSGNKHFYASKYFLITHENGQWHHACKIQVITSGNWTLQLVDCLCVELCSERIPPFNHEVWVYLQDFFNLPKKKKKNLDELIMAGF